MFRSKYFTLQDPKWLFLNSLGQWDQVDLGILFIYLFQGIDGFVEEDDGVVGIENARKINDRLKITLAMKVEPSLVIRTGNTHPGVSSLIDEGMEAWARALGLSFSYEDMGNGQASLTLSNLLSTFDKDNQAELPILFGIKNPGEATRKSVRWAANEDIFLCHLGETLLQHLDTAVLDLLIR